MQLVDDDAADSSVKVNFGGHQHCTKGTKFFELEPEYEFVSLFVYLFLWTPFKRSKK